MIGSVKILGAGVEASWVRVHPVAPVAGVGDSGSVSPRPATTKPKQASGYRIHGE